MSTNEALSFLVLLLIVLVCEHVSLRFMAACVDLVTVGVVVVFVVVLFVALVVVAAVVDVAVAVAEESRLLFALFLLRFSKDLLDADRLEDGPMILWLLLRL